MATQVGPPPGVPFRDPARAERNAAEIEARCAPAARSEATVLLRQNPDPDAAWDGLARFVAGGPAAAETIGRGGRLLDGALTLFAHSRYLGEALIRHPELLAWAMDERHFDRVLSADEMRSDLGWISPDLSDDEAALVVTRFKRAQMLRIALRDLTRVAALAEVALELSNLADAVMQGAHEFIRETLRRRFGRPLIAGPNGVIEDRFAVLALGKLGGRELNYSSDIDLIYLHTGDGETAGPVKTSNRDFHRQSAQRLTRLLSALTPEGFAYRVDLRLRPEGSAGELVVPLDGAVAYYHGRGRDWELQSLIKARPNSGHIRLGEAFLSMVRPLIYRTSTDFSMIERVGESRDRIQQHRALNNRGRIDVKLDRGGIRDIEFLAQCFQRLYGGSDRFVRSGGTLFALHRLREKGYLGMTDYARLGAAYEYLRGIEHLLQLIDNRQTHELPADEDKLRSLAAKARRLDAGPTGGVERVVERIEEHFREVAEIYDRVVGAQRPADGEAEIAAGQESTSDFEAPLDHAWRAHLRHIERIAPETAAAFAALPIRRSGKTFGHLLEKLVLHPEIIAELERRPGLAACLGDLVEHSPYLGEHLVRYYGDIPLLPDASSEAGPDGCAEEAEIAGEYARLRACEDDYNCVAMELRRLHRKRMLMILAESVHLGRPIFETLARTSDLAEWIIGEAYRIAVRQTERVEGERPEEPMQVVALGRLGMREFDLASDADLVFVVPGDDPRAAGWWTRCATRLIEVLSSYTAEGVIFSVDTRLRPRGRDGDLIQSEAAVKAYFDREAEPWEALGYMKARTVAGDRERGAALLAELQQAAGRRFADDVELRRSLNRMRERMEREIGRDSPLKAGVGGYYDIDFILLYLRLKHAGLFFEYLSTPRRIEIVRESGGVTADQADFLLRAATFFRSLDHAVRAATGQTGSRLPATRSLLDSISELIGRWSPIKPSSQPLLSLVEDVRRATRRRYLEIFEPPL